jgi:hypothetical protein
LLSVLHFLPSSFLLPSPAHLLISSSSFFLLSANFLSFFPFFSSSVFPSLLFPIPPPLIPCLFLLFLFPSFLIYILGYIHYIGGIQSDSSD